MRVPFIAAILVAMSFLLPAQASLHPHPASHHDYDPVGNLLFVTDALGQKVGHEYDRRNFRFKENRSLGAIRTLTPNAMADVAEVLDAEGRKTVNTYDFRRRLDTVTNGASEITDFAYDLNGNRIGVLKPKGAGFFQRLDYDAANRLVKVTTPAGASELTYDLHGNLTRKKDALNHSTVYGDFDVRNRRRLTTFADGKTEATTVDGVGNVKTLRDSNGATTTFTYDERHRERFKRYSASVDGLTEIETTYDGVGNVKTTTERYGALVRSHRRDYDAFNRLELEVDPWNDEVSHGYDVQGNRKRTTAQGATTLYDYDELNRRKSVTTAAGVTVLEYDRTHLPRFVRYPNGMVSETTYDRAMRVERVSHTKGATPLESVGHTYDLNGNRKTQARVAGTLAENTTYDYDADDWLTGTIVTKTEGAITSTQAVVYTLDAVGNRKREDSTATGPDAAAKTYAKVFTVDDRDRVRQVAITGAGAGTTTYGYDDNGNLITKSGPAGAKTYVWNARDRLVEVRDGSTPIARYKYNAEGLRDEVEGERRTTWVNGFAYLDKTPAGGLLAKYETHPNGRSPILAVSPTGTEFLHSDALGSSTLSTNAAGAAQAATTYDAFGNSVTTGATVNKFGYTGHETDHNTGLIYFKARHYDPELGKFISADPFEGMPNYPVTWNSYLYANGNPLVWIDREGYESVSTMIDNAASSCNWATCAGWALLKGAYHTATLGFASVHDPAEDAYSEGKISQGQYWAGGVGGGLAVAAVSALTGRAGGGAAATLGQAFKQGAAAGAWGGAATDLATQTAQNAAGMREGIDLKQTAGAGFGGAAGGALFAGRAQQAGQRQAAREAAENQTRAREQSMGSEASSTGRADPPASGTGAQTAHKVTSETPLITGEPPKMGTGLGPDASTTPKSVVATLESDSGKAGSTSAESMRERVHRNIAETRAATQDIDKGLVTMDLRAITSVAAQEVDTLGAQAFTTKQLAAITRNPALEPMFRGNRIDVLAREYVADDPLLRGLQSNYSRGPDFRDLKSGRWWDMTTPGQWNAHSQKYGPNGTLLPTR